MWHRLSLQALVGGGFAIISAALTATIAIAVSNMQALGSQSEALLENGVHITRLTGELVDRITEVERTVRQLEVVRSADLLDVYHDRHQRLKTTLAALQASTMPARRREALERLQTLLEQVEDTVAAGTPLAAARAQPFQAMKIIAGDIRRSAQSGIDRGIARLQTSVAQVRSALIALAAAVVASTLAAVVGFAHLVNRPMRQIRTGIGRIGRAELDEPISVSGPRDLQAIGHSLDWLRERIKTLEAQKSTFVRHMSHELKTPLANIKEGASLLQTGFEADPKSREITRIIQRNAGRLQRQIENLLEYAGWQDDEPPQLPVRFRLDRLTASVIEDHRLELSTLGIRVALHLAPLEITADERHLRTLIDNLVSNALKYSPSGGQITIRLARRDRDAVLDVQDQGPGVPDEHRERVFEPFFRGYQPEVRRTSGTGIGLSLAANIARSHRGTVTVLACARGAHFQVLLPLEENPA